MEDVVGWRLQDVVDRIRGAKGSVVRLNLISKKDGPDGVAHEDIPERLDFSTWEPRFTGGDAYVRGYYQAWFEGPFRAAAVKG